jgi:hypothetical protein
MDDEDGRGTGRSRGGWVRSASPAARMPSQMPAEDCVAIVREDDDNTVRIIPPFGPGARDEGGPKATHDDRVYVFTVHSRTGSRTVMVRPLNRRGAA